MNLQEFKKELYKNPEFKKEYEKFDLIWELTKLWLDIRFWLKFKLKK